jgi:aldose 1-epimerase
MSITPLKAAAILATFLFIPMPKTNAQPARPDSVSSKPFGKTPDGKAIQLYTLINSHGMQVNLSTWGATVVNLLAPDRHGHLADVALGFSTTEPYFTQSPYFGATIGRFANRISPDGEEGYPGNLKVTVTFTLSDRDELRMRYTAETDQPTIVNLTNHTYFNLAGAGNGNILGHQVRIHASHYTPVDKTLIPTGEIKSVAGTPMDLRKWTTVGANIEAVGGKPVGFDHNYVLDRCPVVRPALAAEVLDPRSGRLLKVYTDQPGIQFYTGNFLDGTLHGKHGKVYHQHDAFCLETQHFPDSPNHPNFPSTLLKPGQTYRTTTIYKFSAVTDSGAEIKF